MFNRIEQYGEKIDSSSVDYFFFYFLFRFGYEKVLIGFLLLAFLYTCTSKGFLHEKVGWLNSVLRRFQKYFTDSMYLYLHDDFLATMQHG